MSNFKALIAITTCNRLDYVKAFICDYLVFCNSSDEFDFLLALDGNDKKYIEFCNTNRIPLLYSQEREGVGLSKNRVLKQFPNYDYYFFIEDDVELLNSAFFYNQIKIARITNIHHFSSGEAFRFYPMVKRLKSNENSILFTLYGSGVINFFSKEGLQKVGGWHTEFAKYKRFGHTEHSYRFFNQNLCPAPFAYVEEFENGYFRWHNPQHVTNPEGIERGDGDLAQVESLLIEQKLNFFPVSTLSDFFIENIQNNTHLSFSFSYLSSDSFVHKIIKNDFLNQPEKINLLEQYLKETSEIEKDKQIKTYQKIIFDILQSTTYKIGKMILFPLQKIKTIFYKLFK